MSITNYFIGTKQSKYASIAIFFTILLICLAILFMNTDHPIGHRIAFVIVIVLMAIPSIALSLFELTCIVTGSSKNNKACSWYAWVVTVLIIMYCVIIAYYTINFFLTYKTATEKIIVNNNSKKINSADAENIAKNMMHNPESNNIIESLEQQPQMQQQQQPQMQQKKEKQQQSNNVSAFGGKDFMLLENSKKPAESFIMDDVDNKQMKYDTVPEAFGNMGTFASL